MARFVGIKNGRVNMFSDKMVQAPNLQMIELSEELSNVPIEDLITEFKFDGQALVRKKPKHSPKELRVAAIGNYRMLCGIATFNHNLWSSIKNKVGDLKLFVEKADSYTHPLNTLGDEILPEDNVSVCWKRGESLLPLLEEIRAYKPSVVLISHEWGMFPQLRAWVTFMSQLSNEFRTIVLFHSTFRHADKTIAEMACPEIVVHLKEAKDILVNEKGINGKVHVLPHGCFPCADKTKHWNFYKSNECFFQAGFLSRYKGWETSLKAVKILKQKYPDVYFTGICSESDYGKVEHEMLYNELLDLVNELGIVENVGLVRGFQSEAVLDSVFRTNKVGVYPYTATKGHEVFGVSGIIRETMSKNIPVISSNGNHFLDLPIPKIDTPEQLAEELDNLFSNQGAIDSQLKIQNEFLEKNSWDKVAQMYVDIFTT